MGGGGKLFTRVNAQWNLKKKENQENQSSEKITPIGPKGGVKSANGGISDRGAPAEDDYMNKNKARTGVLLCDSKGGGREKDATRRGVQTKEMLADVGAEVGDAGGVGARKTQ